jgi:hypothetical protein
MISCSCSGGTPAPLKSFEGIPAKVADTKPSPPKKILHPIWDPKMNRLTTPTGILGVFLSQRPLNTWKSWYQHLSVVAKNRWSGPS